MDTMPQAAATWGLTGPEIIDSSLARTVRAGADARARASTITAKVDPGHALT
jgi:hypothetical protein